MGKVWFVGAGPGAADLITVRLVVLLAHLLKWQFQSAYRSTRWRSSIIEQRKQILTPKVKG